MAEITFLNRTACVGGWVTDLLLGANQYYRDGQQLFNNQQKVRTDMWLDIMQGKCKAPSPGTLQHYISQQDYMGPYLQTEELGWNKVKNPKYLIMDSYCELTDKRFQHKDGWIVCGLYSHFNPQLFDQFTDYGLLPIDQIAEKYDQFFALVKKKWNIPIVFIHFPTTFDDREMYIQQGAAITRALDQLAPKYNIQNIHADPEAIEQKDSDYYHFTDKTVANLASKINIKF